MNKPISPESFEINRARVIDYLNQKSKLFIIDGYGGWDAEYRKKVRVICGRPYHALFMKQMLMRGDKKQLFEDFKNP